MTWKTFSLSLFLSLFIFVFVDSRWSAVPRPYLPSYMRMQYVARSSDLTT